MNRCQSMTTNARADENGPGRPWQLQMTDVCSGMDSKLRDCGNEAEPKKLTAKKSDIAFIADRWELYKLLARNRQEDEGLVLVVGVHHHDCAVFQIHYLGLVRMSITLIGVVRALSASHHSLGQSSGYLAFHGGMTGTIVHWVIGSVSQSLTFSAKCHKGGHKNGVERHSRWKDQSKSGVLFLQRLRGVIIISWYCINASGWMVWAIPALL